ncbi:hypothetical protein AVEN_78877-1 [Araneus ventricosus]|uniref:Uncharacterized protein n=1 Tax=Araneus ventricosus TaxID=182803 RepID=A0A4Y2FY74_ARAVE|nr:hypothetical protein AVEN_78877-1 [Araneus ventricosus]
MTSQANGDPVGQIITTLPNVFHVSRSDSVLLQRFLKCFQGEIGFKNFHYIITNIYKDIVHRSDEWNVRVIDKGVKNCWSWNWLEKQIDGVYVREISRKIVKAGIVYGSICYKDLQYDKHGFAVLARHMNSSKHTSNVKARKDNFALLGTSQTAAQEKSSSTYGLHPMFSSAEISTVTRIPRPLIPLIDRVANSEAYASELPG